MPVRWPDAPLTHQLASGAIPCQLLDTLHPSVLAMHKVNTQANTEYEMVNNWKVFQTALEKLRLPKVRRGLNEQPSRRAPPRPSPAAHPRRR